jgi:hypothetical protein
LKAYDLTKKAVTSSLIIKCPFLENPKVIHTTWETNKNVHEFVLNGPPLLEKSHNNP